MGKLDKKVSNSQKNYINNQEKIKSKNTRRCDICMNNIHRSSYAKHLRIKKHSENEKQIELIVTEWFFQKSIEN